MSICNREFVLERDFKFIDDKIRAEPFPEFDDRTHFGLEWSISAKKKGKFLAARLEFDREVSRCSKEKTIDVDFQWKIKNKNRKKSEKSGSHCFTYTIMGGEHWFQFLELEKLKNEFLTDNKFSLECHVEITKIDGFRKKLRQFEGKSAEEVSDVTLIAGNERFLVCKKFLAGQSTFFKSMFSGKSARSEIALEGVPADVFQDFLELLHGESAVIMENVESILQLAEHFGSPMAKRRCTEFLNKYCDDCGPAPGSTNFNEYKSNLRRQYGLEDTHDCPRYGRW